MNLTEYTDYLDVVCFQSLRVLGAHDYPSLFSALILVDPVIFPLDCDRSEVLRLYVSGALGRRQEWASRSVIPFTWPRYFIFRPLFIQEY